MVFVCEWSGKDSYWPSGYPSMFLRKSPLSKQRELAMVDLRAFAAWHRSCAKTNEKINTTNIDFEATVLLRCLTHPTNPLETILIDELLAYLAHSCESMDRANVEMSTERNIEKPITVNRNPLHSVAVNRSSECLTTTNEPKGCMSASVVAQRAIKASVWYHSHC